ncbi:MAG: helix-turn-helix domain-containing protein [Elusimicrobia bacterium]|nr:helix-turn-helix domain-containing protein [Elusimicrobiota bacterium]
MNEEIDDLLLAEEIAEWMKVSVITIRRWTSSGFIPHVRIGQRMVRYRKKDLDSWLNKRSTSGRQNRIPDVMIPVK